MLAVQPRRWLSRPKGLLLFAICAVTLYWLLVHGSGGLNANRWYNGSPAAVQQQQPLEGQDSNGGNSQPAEVPVAPEQPPPVQEPPKPEKTEAEKLREQEEQRQREEEEHKKEDEGRREERLREQFKMEYNELSRKPGADAIYGKTMKTLNTTKERSPEFEAQLTPAENLTYFTEHRPQIYNPYPDYNSKDWLKEHAKYVPCKGATGEDVSDIMVFKGVPEEWPAPLFGSYKALGIDGDLCYERETRLGHSGFQADHDKSEPLVNWEKVRWGQLQETCIQKNKARYDMQGKPNPYVNSVYPREELEDSGYGTDHKTRDAAAQKYSFRRNADAASERRDAEYSDSNKSRALLKQEARTAILLRSYTGKEYNENDKQVIRSLVTELSLRSGGQYQVFLLVHVKDKSYDIWDDESIYQYVLEKNIPEEFRDMTILWNDEATHSMYTKLSPESAAVHFAQWLPLQKFSKEYPEFEYFWNWEMDARLTGQNYDFLEKISSFGKAQPRRGLWERSERYYIPSSHGDYDKEFREEVERVSGEDTIWGPLEMPFINPVGPKPPVANPRDDNYKWGIGEDADVITLAPIYNVSESTWIGGNDVWGFSDASHATLDLPRRCTIVTHSRVSKRLLDIMHVENLRGNHITSEMAPQTVSMLHGLKAVFAPMPMYFDRGWKGQDLARWFNSGRKGESGGINAPAGWGREARYGGSTWYYRATPPQRLYTNFMGWEDNGRGGEKWENENGRICLPTIMMHPVKDVEPTEPGYRSESILPFG